MKIYLAILLAAILAACGVSPQNDYRRPAQTTATNCREWNPLGLPDKDLLVADFWRRSKLEDKLRMDFAPTLITEMDVICTNTEKANARLYPDTLTEAMVVTTRKINQKVAAEQAKNQSRRSVDDPFQAVSKVRESIRNLPKLDQFSTTADRARYSELASNPPLEALTFTTRCSKTYNADTQVLTIHLTPDVGEPDWSLNLVTNRQTTGTYAGQNAFGAKVLVEKEVVRKVDLRWKPEPGNKPRSVTRQRYLATYWEYIADVSLVPEEARAAVTDIRCLIVVRPTAPFILYDQDHTQPTLRAPSDRTTERTILIGKFEELWVVNERTGKIYARFN